MKAASSQPYTLSNHSKSLSHDQNLSRVYMPTTRLITDWKINYLIKKIETTKLISGIYIWKLYNNSTQIESRKIIIKRTVMTQRNSILIFCLLLSFTGLGQQCLNCDSTNSASGDFSTAIGHSSIASGFASFAAGAHSEAVGSATISLGLWNLNTAEAYYSTTIGSYCKTTANSAMVLGAGISENNYLTNSFSYSLMIGFNSQYPTLFVSTSPSYDKTGKIGLGNVYPQAKLHLRADDGEEAAVFIEPNNWNAGEKAKIILGDTNHFISTSKSIGLEFNSTSNFVFNGKNTGFGVEEPKAKVHINGDLLFEHNLNGIIMKSEDGNCWKGTISNNGELIFSQVDCETLLSTENITETKHSEIFIYPNPTNGQITVEYTGNRKNLRLEIKSISGHLVATYKIKKGDNRIELNNISDQMIVASVFTKKGELISTNKVVIKK